MLVLSSTRSLLSRLRNIYLIWANFYGSLLEEQDDQTIELGSVEKQLRAYIALQKKGSYAHVEVTIDIPKALRKVRIPTGLFQPLVENSFKYAGHEERKGTDYSH
jgi:LytS/YehU family sensor histidine kinase